MRFTPVLLLVACHHGGAATSPPACTLVADHVAGLLPKDDPDAAAAIRDLFAARCARDAWPQAARDCMLDTRSLHDGKHCKDKLSVEQRAQLDSDLGIVEHARWTKLPGECVAYRKAVERLSDCAGMPQASKDALRQGMEATVRAWEQTAPADRHALVDSCKAAVDAVVQTGSAMCGW